MCYKGGGNNSTHTGPLIRCPLGIGGWMDGPFVSTPWRARWLQCSPCPPRPPPSPSFFFSGRSDSERSGARGALERGGGKGLLGEGFWGGLGQLQSCIDAAVQCPLSPLVLAPLVLTPLQRFTDAFMPGHESDRPGDVPLPPSWPLASNRSSRAGRTGSGGIGGGAGGKGWTGPGGPPRGTSGGNLPGGAIPAPLLPAPASPSDAELDSHPPTCLARGLAAPRRAPGSAGRGAGCGPGMGGGRNSEADSSPLRRRSPPPPPHNPPANKYPRRKRRAVPDFAPSGCVSTTQPGSRAGWPATGRDRQGAGQGG